jgi:adenine C2-methylase RlmN of 23S rRNA A2503 and tRNA A37
MGMGEPLHNYDAVMTAVDILRDTAGLSLGTKQITLSTVGVVPGIRRLAARKRPMHLAVSLHGATQAGARRPRAGGEKMAARRADGRLPLLHRHAPAPDLL